MAEQAERREPVLVSEAARRPHCILQAAIQQLHGLYICLNGRQIAAFLSLFALATSVQTSKTAQ